MTRWREYLTTLVIAVFFALFVRSYLVTAYKVPTGSMQPTLKPGDFIFSSRVSYGIRLPFTDKIWDITPPERGDLIVFTYSNQPGISYVKRVIGLPGDKIEIKDGRVILNDQPLEYVKAVDNTVDNPNPGLFEVFEEKYQDSSWRVIFQKQMEGKDFGPIIVPPDEAFILGDNRDASDDSRYWGSVPTSQIVGKVVLIWLSLDWQEKWGGDRYPTVRWNRVFSTVH
ncbi:signal peptidase I [Bdellovibrio sp. KM01]|uniref:signal peptidase I n=1 Tax=Bdellovibrio sp. KM01 TaxID=2748865 RepID=UPI0015E96760|nr:signal peptidase I [Bdellovibrio sp. KM01]QLY24765.1 signal peptidase I [Bdellovibrio sp. KM01]